MREITEVCIVTYLIPGPGGALVEKRYELDIPEGEDEWDVAHGAAGSAGWVSYEITRIAIVGEIG